MDIEQEIFMDTIEQQIADARTFLASIASAKPLGTVQQSEWMIAQAREGLRRAGGHDFDQEGEST